MSPPARKSELLEAMMEVRKANSIIQKRRCTAFKANAVDRRATDVSALRTKLLPSAIAMSGRNPRLNMPAISIASLLKERRISVSDIVEAATKGMGPADSASLKEKIFAILPPDEGVLLANFLGTPPPPPPPPPPPARSLSSAFPSPPRSDASP